MREFLGAARGMGGDLEQRLVAQHAVARQVAPLRRGLAPARQLAQQGEHAPVGAAGLKPAPRLGRVEPVGRGIGELGHLLAKPMGAAAGLEALAELLVDAAQRHDVAERVFELALGQGPARPVGEARRFVDARAGQPAARVS